MSCLCAGLGRISVKALLSFSRLRLNKLDFTERERLVSSPKVPLLALRHYCPRLTWRSDGTAPPKLCIKRDIAGALGYYGRQPPRGCLIEKVSVVKGGCRICSRVVEGEETGLLGGRGEAESSWLCLVPLMSCRQ